MKLDYVTVPEHRFGFGYCFIAFISFIFNIFLLLSNNYTILFTCLFVPICIYFNKLDISICFFMAMVFMGRILTYENQHYDNNKNINETDINFNVSKL